MEAIRKRKVFVINAEQSIILTACDVVVDGDEQSCPAFASCCEYGDICQIEGRDCYFHQRESGFPTWCPLDNK